MQSRIKDTGIELLIVFGIGGLIGTIISWTSNAYVSGVQFFTALRENHSILRGVRHAPSWWLPMRLRFSGL